MRAIVVGAGEVGYHVAERLSNEQHDVVVVDLAASRLDYVQSHLDVGVVEGSGASPAVLKKAGIDDAALLVSVTSVDEVNLVCCTSAQSHPGLLKIARVSNPDFYRGESQLHPERFGVDVMINPERELAMETFRLLQASAATDIVVFAGGAVQVLGIAVQEESPIVGRTLAEVSSKDKRAENMIAAAIERDGITLIPHGGTIVEPGDHIYVVTNPDRVSLALELCGHEHARLKRVMVAGGSREGYYLGEMLQQHGVQTTILVRDRKRAQELAERLDKTLILNGDATDVELLELEGVAGVDAFLALTDDDETNILSALVAKDIGAKQVVTLVNKVDYLPLARRIGLDAAVSPRMSAANAILRYIRRGAVMRVAILKDSMAEAMQFHVTSTAPIVGKQLQETEFPENALIGAIVRGAEVVIPRGADVFQAGDTVIAFVLPEAADALARMFPE